MSEAITSSEAIGLILSYHSWYRPPGCGKKYTKAALVAELVQRLRITPGSIEWRGDLWNSTEGVRIVKEAISDTDITAFGTMTITALMDLCSALDEYYTLTKSPARNKVGENRAIIDANMKGDAAGLWKDKKPPFKVPRAGWLAMDATPPPPKAAAPPPPPAPEPPKVKKLEVEAPVRPDVEEAQEEDELAPLLEEFGRLMAKAKRFNEAIRKGLYPPGMVATSMKYGTGFFKEFVNIVAYDVENYGTAEKLADELEWASTKQEKIEFLKELIEELAFYVESRAETHASGKHEIPMAEFYAFYDTALEKEAARAAEETRRHVEWVAGEPARAAKLAAKEAEYQAKEAAKEAAKTAYIPGADDTLIEDTSQIDEFHDTGAPKRVWVLNNTYVYDVGTNNSLGGWLGRIGAPWSQYGTAPATFHWTKNENDESYADIPLAIKVGMREDSRKNTYIAKYGYDKGLKEYRRHGGV
jgi:hypothetical protein